jgi:hypothetical protein
VPTKIAAALRHPFSAAAITLIIIVTGLLGSIFSAEIRRAFPFYWGPGRLSPQAVIFWALAVISALAYFFREQSVTAEEQRVRRLGLSQAQRFETLIRTLPPANFLELFSKFLGAADNVVEAAFKGARPAPQAPDIVEESVRHLLRMIATLAQEFDGGHGGVEYAANIMIFKSPEMMSKEEQGDIKKRLLFSDESVAVENLRGVLELQLPLSATAAAEAAPPDPRMKPIVLPIPKTSKTDGRFKVFPGAPLAFVERELDVYTDTSGLAAWCEKYGDFTDEVIDAIGSYFAGSHIRSFVSIPLFDVGVEGSDQRETDPVAILNIHSTRKGLLHGRGEPLVHFVAIMQPFKTYLGRLLKGLRTNTESSNVE